MGCRIYVSDVQESVYMVRYKRNENQLIIFADDTQPRYITAMEILDYNTVATADKCGNISVVCLWVQIKTFGSIMFFFLISMFYKYTFSIFR